MSLRCGVTDVLCSRVADAGGCCVVCCLFVFVLSVVSFWDVQGGVARISGNGTFSAEHCTFSQNTAGVSPVVRALLRVMSQYL